MVAPSSMAYCVWPLGPGVPFTLSTSVMKHSASADAPIAPSISMRNVAVAQAGVASEWTAPHLAHCQYWPQPERNLASAVAVSACALAFARPIPSLRSATESRPMAAVSRATNVSRTSLCCGGTTSTLAASSRRWSVRSSIASASTLA
eukprot:6783758-Prymnesium_polylepis.1